MARGPGWLDKVNYAVKFIQAPCNAPMIVYVETLLPAAGHAILALLEFGMDDVIRGFARPVSGRTRWHRRRGRKGRLKLRGIPELGEAIGARLPGAELVSGRAVTQGVRNLWIVDGVLQRGLFWWLVIDIVGEFFFEWSTLLVKRGDCPGPFPGNLLARGSGGSILALLGWEAIILPNLVYANGGTHWNVSTGTLPKGLFQVVVAMEMHNFTDETPTVLMGIFKNPLFSAAYDVSDPIKFAPRSTRKGITAAFIEGPTTFTIGWRVSFKTVVGIKGDVVIMQVSA